MHIKENSDFNTSTDNSVGINISQDSYSDEDRFFCRICHMTDEESTSYFSESKGGEWLHPCSCSGTMKWVHRGCMGTWLDSAPYPQRYQCTLCNYYYRLTWRIRPLINWRFPRFNLTFWDRVEITFDVLYTYYAIRSVINVFTNQAKSLFRSVPFLASWYFFVANDRRFDFYRRLFIIFISTFLETTVRNAI